MTAETAAPNRLLKKLAVCPILGGAALQCCDQRFVCTSGFSRRGQAVHRERVFQQRLAEVPGLGVDSAQQIIAEVGATAATFASAKNLASWVGACPGDQESAEVSYSHRSPKGSRPMRRILNQAANAAVRMKGSIFQILYRRLVPRLGHHQTIGAIAHRLCRLIWLILRQGVRYEERGPAVSQRSQYQRTRKMIRQLLKLGYRVERLSAAPNAPAPAQ